MATISGKGEKSYASGFAWCPDHDADWARFAPKLSALLRFMVPEIMEPSYISLLAQGSGALVSTMTLNPGNQFIMNRFRHIMQSIGRRCIALFSLRIWNGFRAEST